MSVMSPHNMPPDAHSLRFNGPVNNIHEAPAIGNGDLGGLVQVFQNELRLHLAKNDIWDARFDHITAESVFTQDDLIRASRHYGFRLEGPAYRWEPKWDRTPPESLRYVEVGPGWDKIYPCPKPAGWVRILHSGTSDTKIETVVDIARGVVRARYDLDYGWHGTGVLLIEAFVERSANAVRMRLRTEGTMGDIWLCIEKQPDPLDATLPPPEVRLDDKWRGTVTQSIPGEFDVAPFAWHLAGCFPRPAKGRMVRPVQAQVCRLLQVCNVEPGQSLEFCVGVATDRDGPGDSRARALAIAGADPSAAYDAALGAHEESWRRFWSASGVELEDKELEAAWYRNVFALACHIAPHAQAPGLCANVVPYETSPWHGGYTVNMNIQKMFLASLPTNHPEWIECYARWLDHMMPSFEHLARLIFGLEGIHSVHMLMPYVPPHRQANCNTAGRALGMTGWHGQPLWWHWQYARDQQFLRDRAYPYFKKAAQFYWRYFQKYMDESGDLYPSLNLEGPPWTRDLERNRDCFIDLILIRHAFEWAIEASEILGVDEDCRSRWREALRRVRPVRCEWLPDGSGWIASDKNAPKPLEPEWWRLREWRQLAVTAAWCVFPGEYVEGDEEGGFACVARDIMERTRWHELHPEVIWIHHWWCAIPALRMGLKEAFDLARAVILRERFPAGHAKTTHWINLQPAAWRCPEDNYLGAVATTEMLLQSQGEVMRLFPAWPRDMAARFRGLPARGGFLVSAQWHPQRGLSADITSVAGEPCRIRWPQDQLPSVTLGGQPTPVRREGRDIVFDTDPGAHYRLQAHVQQV